MTLGALIEPHRVRILDLTVNRLSQVRQLDPGITGVCLRLRDQGLIPEAVRALQKHAFLDLGCSAMWCGYYDGNENSKRCQEKCGFKYHHTEENKPCALMGDVRTEHFTYLTKEQWSDSQDRRI